MNTITYTQARQEDCLEIAQLKGEVWRTTYRGIYADSALDNYDAARNRQTFMSIISNPDIALIIAKDGDQIIGLMTCGALFRPYLHYRQEIGLLYILKQYQRHGIGRELFSIAKAAVKSNGYDEFIVSCNRYNVNALEFYRKMGGTVIYMDDDQTEKSESEVKFHYQI